MKNLMISGFAASVIMIVGLIPGQASAEYSLPKTMAEQVRGETGEDAMIKALGKLLDDARSVDGHMRNNSFSCTPVSCYAPGTPQGEIDQTGGRCGLVCSITVDAN